ncbi:MAG: hypothetical protein SGCHY_000573 [Lobulomycetales sp.]
MLHVMFILLAMSTVFCAPTGTESSPCSCNGNGAPRSVVTENRYTNPETTVYDVWNDWVCDSFNSETEAALANALAIDLGRRDKVHDDLARLHQRRLASFKNVNDLCGVLVMLNNMQEKEKGWPIFRKCIQQPAPSKKEEGGTKPENKPTSIPPQNVEESTKPGKEPKSFPPSPLQIKGAGASAKIKNDDLHPIPFYHDMNKPSDSHQEFSSFLSDWLAASSSYEEEDDDDDSDEKRIHVIGKNPKSFPSSPPQMITGPEASTKFKSRDLHPIPFSRDMNKPGDSHQEFSSFLSNWLAASSSYEEEDDDDDSDENRVHVIPSPVDNSKKRRRKSSPSPTSEQERRYKKSSSMDPAAQKYDSSASSKVASVKPIEGGYIDEEEKTVYEHWSDWLQGRKTQEANHINSVLQSRLNGLSLGTPEGTMDILAVLDELEEERR